MLKKIFPNTSVKLIFACIPLVFHCKNGCNQEPTNRNQIPSTEIEKSKVISPKLEDSKKPEPKLSAEEIARRSRFIEKFELLDNRIIIGYVTASTADKVIVQTKSDKVEIMKSQIRIRRSLKEEKE